MHNKPVEPLAEAHAEIEHLKAENERLRKELDYVALCLETSRFSAEDIEYLSALAVHIRKRTSVKARTEDVPLSVDPDEYPII